MEKKAQEKRHEALKHDGSTREYKGGECIECGEPFKKDQGFPNHKKFHQGRGEAGVAPPKGGVWFQLKHPSNPTKGRLGRIFFRLKTLKISNDGGDSRLKSAVLELAVYIPLRPRHFTLTVPLSTQVYK